MGARLLTRWVLACSAFLVSIACPVFGAEALVEEDSESTESTAPLSSTAKLETAFTTPAEPPEVPERPWLYSTALGTTAFVLDRGAVEVGFFVPSRLPDMSVRYGLTDAVTVSAGTFLHALSPIAEVKWNVLNAGIWSFAIKSLASIRPGQGDSRLGFTVVASRAMTEFGRMHFSLEGVHRHEEWWGGALPRRTLGQDFRAMAEIESRFGRRHGASVSVAHSRGRSYDGVWFERSSSGWGLGLSYLYFQKSFGLSVGLECGPGSSSWTDTTGARSSSYDEPEHFKVQGLGATLDVRL